MSTLKVRIQLIINFFYLFVYFINSSIHVRV